MIHPRIQAVQYVVRTTSGYYLLFVAKKASGQLNILISHNKRKRSTEAMATRTRAHAYTRRDGGRKKRELSPPCSGTTNTRAEYREYHRTQSDASKKIAYVYVRRRSTYVWYVWSP